MMKSVLRNPLLNANMMKTQVCILLSLHSEIYLHGYICDFKPIIFFHSRNVVT